MKVFTSLTTATALLATATTGRAQLRCGNLDALASGIRESGCHACPDVEAKCGSLACGAPGSKAEIKEVCADLMRKCADLSCPDAGDKKDASDGNKSPQDRLAVGDAKKAGSGSGHRHPNGSGSGKHQRTEDGKHGDAKHEDNKPDMEKGLGSGSGRNHFSGSGSGAYKHQENDRPGKLDSKKRGTDCSKLPKKQGLSKAICESAAAKAALKSCAKTAGGATKLSELAKACADKRGLKTKVMKYLKRQARVKGRMTPAQKEAYEAAVLTAYKASGGEFTYTEKVASGRGRRLSGVDTTVDATLSYDSDDDAEAAKGTRKADVEKELAGGADTKDLEETDEVVTTETVEVVDEADAKDGTAEKSGSGSDYRHFSGSGSGKHQRTEDGKQNGDKHEGSKEGDKHDDNSTKRPEDDKLDCASLKTTKDQMRCCLKMQSESECAELAKEQLPTDKWDGINAKDFCTETQDDAQVLRCCAMNKRENCPDGKGKVAVLDCAAAAGVLEPEQEALCCFSGKRDNALCRASVGTKDSVPDFCDNDTLTAKQQMRCRGNGKDVASAGKDGAAGDRKKDPVDPLRITEAVDEVADKLPEAGQKCIKAVAKATHALKTVLVQWHEDKPTETMADDETMSRQAVADLFADLVALSEQSEQLEADFEEGANFEALKEKLGMPKGKLGSAEETGECKAEFAAFRDRFDDVVNKFDQVPRQVRGAKAVKIALSQIDLGSVDLEDADAVCGFAQNLVSTLREAKANHEQRLKAARKVLCEEASDLVEEAKLAGLATCLNQKARAAKTTAAESNKANEETDGRKYAKVAAEGSKLFAVIKRKCVARGSGTNRGGKRMDKLSKRKIKLSVSKTDGATLSDSEKEIVRGKIKKAVKDIDADAENIAVTFEGEEQSKSLNLRRNLAASQVTVTYDNTNAPAVGDVDAELEAEVGSDFQVDVQEDTTESAVDAVAQPLEVAQIPVVEDAVMTTTEASGHHHHSTTEYMLEGGQAASNAGSILGVTTGMVVGLCAMVLATIF